jgi:hypothetical protein
MLVVNLTIIFYIIVQIHESCLANKIYPIPITLFQERRLS